MLLKHAEKEESIRSIRVSKYEAWLGWYSFAPLLHDSHCVFATPFLATLLIAGFAQASYPSLCLVYHGAEKE